VKVKLPQPKKKSFPLESSDSSENEKSKVNYDWKETKKKVKYLGNHVSQTKEDKVRVKR
jgi:hypothetical protein